MAKLPQQLEWHQADDRWATAIEPVINNPINQGLLLQNIALVSGPNVINHKLGRKLVGWMIASIDAPATVYDTQASNQMPALTLQLTASAACQVSIWAF